MPVARNRGCPTRSCWSGLQRKELAARVYCMRCNNGRLSSTERVAEFWPEFGQAEKDKITFEQLLSHQAGLCALDQRVDVLDYDGVIRALETQAPLWLPGTGHGYHARTFGFLLDELIRRITGNNAVGLLAGKFCPAARTRFLDRLAGKGECASGHDLRCQKRQAAGAGRVLSRSCYTRYVGEKDVYLALWIECHQQDE